MHNDSSVIALVARVSGGDQEAWNEIIERYVAAGVVASASATS